MPFLRTARGLREDYTPARLSALLSLVYQAAYGAERFARHRPDIMRRVQQVWGHLEQRFGGGTDDEWPGREIYKAIDEELLDRVEVHEAWRTLRADDVADLRGGRTGGERAAAGGDASGNGWAAAERALRAGIAARQGGSGGRGTEVPAAERAARALDPLNATVDPIWGIVVHEDAGGAADPEGPPGPTAPEAFPLGSPPSGAPIGSALGVTVGAAAAWRRSDVRRTDATARERARPDEDFLPFALTERLGVATDGTGTDPDSWRWAVEDPQRSNGAPVAPAGRPGGGDGPSQGATAVGRRVVQIRRSEWIQFWRECPRPEKDPGALAPAWPGRAWEAFVLALGNDQRLMTVADWWTWWEDQIDAFQQQTPTGFLLRRALHEVRRRALITGQGWIDGSPVRPDAPLRMAFSRVGESWYRRLGCEHLKAVFDRHHPTVAWDWAAVSAALEPGRDALLDWAAWQDMDEAGALWPIQVPRWGHGEQPADAAREMPQWAWMHAAMALAVYDDEPEGRTAHALELYQQMSQLRLVPSAAALREGGKTRPRYFEDQSWEVPDNFEGIQNVIHHAAVDTTWTGTCASQWSRVRGQGAPVRWGRRESKGVCDFLRIVDQHMRAQGRQGDDRPATVLLHAWHLDTEAFIRLPSNGGERLRCVLVLPDLFMERLANNEPWTLFDPSIYSEALQGRDGYLEAERAMARRAAVSPWAQKTVAITRLWAAIVEQCRLGHLFLAFDDADRPFATADTPHVHGLDGVGVFSLPTHVQAARMETSSAGTDSLRQAQRLDQVAPRRVAWPALAVNVAAFLSDYGEPDVGEWGTTIRWALWAADRMYDAAASEQGGAPPATRLTRPVCLGVIGFYEAVQKAVLGGSRQASQTGEWVARISETWTALVTAEDQALTARRGPAPVWRQHAVPTTPFHPAHGTQRLRTARRGGVRVQEPRSAILTDLFDGITGHRFSVRTVWAPFRTAARWAGVTPGGFGTLAPVEWAIDPLGRWRLSPTAFLKSEIRARPQDASLSAIFRHPGQPARWPEHVVRLCVPNSDEWETRLEHLALVRPWIDQGISLTLPTRVKNDKLAMLIRRAWWSGASSVRFEDLVPQNRPGSGATEDSVEAL